MATKVTLRSRPISKGRRTLFLDFYPKIRHPETGKMIGQYFLKMYIYDSPSNTGQREYNKEKMKLAEGIRALRELDIIAGEYGFLSEERFQGDFLEFFRQEALKHNNIWESCYKHFYTFVRGHCTFSEVTLQLCERFREYLLQAPSKKNPEKTISQNSAANYYLKFQSMIHIASARKVIKDVTINKSLRQIKKSKPHIEFLIPSELYALSKTPCRIPVLKRAALFSCLTGLRASDVETLSWTNIVRNLSGTGYNLRLCTTKTKEEALLPLSDDALAMCGPRGEGLVFEGLKRTMMREPMFEWIKKAGIEKHISFHCFRHTYAILQLAGGTDIYTVSKMLTHKSIKSTEIYLDLLEETKIETTGRILIYRDPELLAA